MPPQGAAYNVDWIFSNNSNVYACNHRDWFTSFTPFKSQSGSLYSSSNLDIEGVGDVELELRRIADNKKKIKGPRSSKIILHDVIYCPSLVCNIVGSPLFKDFKLVTDFSDGGTLRDKNTGALLGLLDCVTMIKLLLKGQSKGQTSLDAEGMYLLNITWPESEQKRWQEHKKTLEIDTNLPDRLGGMMIGSQGGAKKAAPKSASDAAEQPPYTDEEKKWLKDNYGGEFKFLRDHGLSIYKDEDREDGRQIMRQIKGSEEEDEDESYDSDGSGNSFLREIEADPMSHMSDYLFSSAELDWIKKHFRHSANFLRSYGLRPYDDDHCNEGLELIKTLMEGEGD